MRDDFAETYTFCLPVTALHTVQDGARTLLLVAQGPFLSVYDVGRHHILVTRHVFDNQTIHNIASSPSKSRETGSLQFMVALAGGAEFAILTLDASDNTEIKTVSHGNVVNDEILTARDWIVTIKPYAQFDSTCSFIVLTANNELYKIDAETSKVTFVVRGPDAFLYSGDVRSNHHGQLLVASGSAFGEVIYWVCERSKISDDWIVMRVSKFEGHKGSVFGVDISDEFEWLGKNNRLLASCSDDRRMNVWMATGDLVSKLDVDIESMTSTGFVNDLKNSENLLASGSGHLSRIWSVNTIVSGDTSDANFYLLSRGEDATFQIWRVTLPSTTLGPDVPAKLRLMTSDHHHSGKNIWSWTRCTIDGRMTVVTGGADGKVVSRAILDDSSTFERLDLESLATYLQLEPSISIKAYTILDKTRMLAITSCRDLLTLNRGSYGEWKWEVIRRSSTDGGWDLVNGASAGAAVAICKDWMLVWLPTSSEPVQVSAKLEAPVTWTQIAAVANDGHANQSSMCVLLSCPNRTSITMIIINPTEQPVISDTTVLQLPKGLTPTSSALNFSRRFLVLGCRNGSIVIYDLSSSHSSDEVQPYVWTHVHGFDSVTSISVIHQPDELSSVMFLLTTGRDGTCAIHRLRIEDQSRIPAFETVHRCTPAFGPNIEGAIVVTSRGNKAQESQDLILYGFKSTKFIVYNVATSSDLMSVECGGAHRSWHYRHNTSTNGGTFVWTKSGACNIYTTSEAAHSVIGPGGHGREIKALAISPSPCVTSDPSLSGASIIATGAEDTTIRIFALPRTTASASIPDPSSFVCLATLSDHTVGPQYLAFSSCGNFLFSSGGCEQFHVYKLAFYIPLVKVGVVLQDVMPLTKGDEDVRIMGFQMNAVSSGSNLWNIVMAYSNGKTKLVRYHCGREAGSGKFEVLREVLFGSFCLMHSLLLPVLDIDTRQRLLLTAGTNGLLNLTPVPAGTSHREAKMLVRKVHQSSILGLDTWTLADGRIVIITGGDDNALGITLLSPATSPHSAFRDEQMEDLQLETVLIPKAHAAAVTAVRIIKVTDIGRAFKALVASSACDQRVILWEITITLPSTTQELTMLEYIQVVKLKSTWTCVADVSQLDVVGTFLDDGKTWAEVIVVGVGMEVLRLRLTRD